MNDTFNLKRFSLLLKKSVLERPFHTVGLTALVLCFTLIIYAGFLYFGGWGAAQNLSFIWGFIGGGVCVASGVFNYFNTNASGSAYLTLPASAFEKWLCGVLIAGVFFFLLFFGFYRLIDTCFVTAYHNGLDRSSALYHIMYDAVRIKPFEGNLVATSIMMFVNFVGAILVGSFYFNKAAIVKTAMVTCGVILFIYLLNLLIAKVLFVNVDQASPFYNVFILVGKDMGAVELPAGASKISNIVFYYLMPAVLWITAYIRLREKEI